MELKNLLLHFFVLSGCKPPLADVIKGPRLVGFMVTEFCLSSTRTQLSEPSLTEIYMRHVASDRSRYTCSVYEPSRAWVTNEQGSRPVATSSRSCRHNRYLQKTKMCNRDNMHEKKVPQSPIPWDQHQLVNHISCRFPGCYNSLLVRWFYQFSGITSCLTLIKAILWHNMSSYS